MTELNIEKARFNMVEQQIRTWEVLDPRVLDAVMQIPRECFVPPGHRNLAFADLRIPLGHDQVMLEPKLDARIVQALNPQPTEQALEIGTGSGYLTAVLASLCAHVTSVEIHPEFSELAANNLKAQGIDNVTLETGDASQGWGSDRRFDVIAVTGSVPQQYRAFHDKLSIGGRLLQIVGEGPIMEALLITRVAEDQWASESLLDTVAPPLIQAREPARFAL